MSSKSPVMGMVFRSGLRLKLLMSEAQTRTISLVLRKKRLILPMALLVILSPMQVGKVGYSIALTSAELMERVEAQVPKPWWEVWEDMRAASIPEHVIAKLVVSPQLPIYAQAIAEGADPRLAAFTLVETYRYLSRKGVDLESIPQSSVVFLFTEVEKGMIFKDAIPRILEKMGADGIDPIRAIEKLHIRPITRKMAEKTIKSLVRKNPDLLEMFRSGREGPLMGVIMGTLNGYFNGAQAYEIVRSL